MAGKLRYCTYLYLFDSTCTYLYLLVPIWFYLYLFDSTLYLFVSTCTNLYLFDSTCTYLYLRVPICIYVYLIVSTCTKYSFIFEFGWLCHIYICSNGVYFKLYCFYQFWWHSTNGVLGDWFNLAWHVYYYDEAAGVQRYEGLF